MAPEHTLGPSSGLRRESNASYSSFVSDDAALLTKEPGVGGPHTVDTETFGSKVGLSTGLDDWRSVIGVAVCLFCVHCQPSEAYLTRYLRDDVGISEDDLDQYVWPTDTWTQLVTLIPAGLLAEVVGLRPVALFGLTCRLVTRIILIWGRGVGEMAAMQGMYAIGTNADVLLLTIMYVAVRPAKFRVVTGIAFAAQHIGSFAGSGIGQAMADSEPHNLRRLFFVSWGFTTAGLCAFAALCGPPRRTPPVALATLLTTEGVAATWKVICGLYRTETVRKWASWYFFVNSLNNLMLNYYQNQASRNQHVACSTALGSCIILLTPRRLAGLPQIQDADQHARLGLYQMLLEFCGVCGVAAATGLSSQLIHWPSTVISLTSAAGAAAYLIALDNSSKIDAVCAGNALAFAIGLFSSTAGSYTVAETINVQKETDDSEDSRYAVVFTCNGTLALVWASIISAIGTGRKWDTPDFYRAAVIELFTFSVVVLLLEAALRCYRGRLS